MKCGTYRALNRNLSNIANDKLFHKSHVQDKSPQGYMDRDIVPLLDAINKRNEYETTSSCSGRIVVIDRLEKGLAKWLFKTHKAANPEDVWQAVRCGRKVWFLQEPVILHVRCASQQAAQQILNAAYKAGLKHSGILSTNTWFVEIRGSERIEAPLDACLFSKEFIRFLVEEANCKLAKTKNRIGILKDIIDKID